MTCREIREALDALLDGELDAGEELTVREHLDWCRPCAQDYNDLCEWHGSLADALAGEAVRPTTAERRRTADAVIAAIRPRTVPMSRLAALVAIGLSVGIVASAVAFSRPAHDQVARVVERIRERQSRDAQLRAVRLEIESDLGEARKVVAARGPADPGARSVAIGSLNIARQLGADPVEELHRYRELVPPAAAPPAECVSITRTVDGATISVTQKTDGRIRVAVPGYEFEVRSMKELLSDHGELCRRYGISGWDGFLAVGDSVAGADWKGRLNLLLRTGAWDEQAQWDAYRDWAAAKAGDAREFERRIRGYQERCRDAAKTSAAAPASVNVEAILREVRTLTRGELKRTQERIESETKKLEARLQEAQKLRDRARGLRLFAEDVTRD
jgi:anti-sigma factor RsiW